MNIYVGNLPYVATEYQLRQAFGQYGEVSSVNIITDRYTGKSRGFGFVEMPDDGMAQQAIDALNNTDLGGRSITVNQAKPKTERSRGGGGRGPRDW